MPVVRERAAAHLDNARREQRCNWVSDTCNRSPTHGPETYTEASTDAVEKSQLEETVELNQGIARMARVKVSSQRQMEVSDGGGCV